LLRRAGAVIERIPVTIPNPNAFNIKDMSVDSPFHFHSYKRDIARAKTTNEAGELFAESHRVTE